VDSRLSDLKIHSIIDRLNPNLRSIDNFNGQKRVREFYAMSPEDAYSILEAIAEINGCADRLKLIEPNAEEIMAEETARDIDSESKERLSPFSFVMCQIPAGAVLEYSNRGNPNTGTTCVVADERNVEYQGKKWSLSALATELTGSKWPVAGTRYFKYQGKWLNDIRRRLGV